MCTPRAVAAEQPFELVGLARAWVVGGRCCSQQGVLEKGMQQQCVGPWARPSPF